MNQTGQNMYKAIKVHICNWLLVWPVSGLMSTQELEEAEATYPAITIIAN